MSDSIPEHQFTELADYYDEAYTAVAAMFPVVQATMTYRKSGSDADLDTLHQAVDSYEKEHGSDLPVSSYYR